MADLSGTTEHAICTTNFRKSSLAAPAPPFSQLWPYNVYGELLQQII